MCEQQRRRSAYTSISLISLCCSLTQVYRFYKAIQKANTDQTVDVQAVQSLCCSLMVQGTISRNMTQMYSVLVSVFNFSPGLQTEFLKQGCNSHRDSRVTIKRRVCFLHFGSKLHEIDVFFLPKRGVHPSHPSCLRACSPYKLSNSYNCCYICGSKSLRFFNFRYVHE